MCREPSISSHNLCCAQCLPLQRRTGKNVGTPYRTFKAYDTEYVQRHLRSEFSTLVSYSRFVELMPTVLVPLVTYLHTQLGRCTDISFIDSTSLAVCHNPRIHQHRVFAGRAARGKTSVGWFYGFKLHRARE